MNAAWEYPGTGSISANSALFVGFTVGKHVGILSFSWLVMCLGIAIRPPEFGWRLLAGGGLDVPVDRGDTLLGVKLEVDHLRIAPCIPARWKSYKTRYRYRETVYHITSQARW